MRILALARRRGRCAGGVRVGGRALPPYSVVVHRQRLRASARPPAEHPGQRRLRLRRAYRRHREPRLGGDLDRANRPARASARADRGSTARRCRAATSRTRAGFDLSLAPPGWVGQTSCADALAVVRGAVDLGRARRRRRSCSPRRAVVRRPGRRRLLAERPQRPADRARRRAAARSCRRSRSAARS